MADLRQGGNYTQADPLVRGPASFIAYVAFEEVGRYPTSQEAEEVVRRAFDGGEIRRIEVVEETLRP